MEKNISNRRVYTYIAIIFLVIFIIGLIALGVFRFASGSGSNTPTYYSYEVKNSDIPSDAHLEDDNKTFILHTNVKYHEVITFNASTDVVIGSYNHPDHYVFGGTILSFTFKVEEEHYYLSTATIDEIRVSNSDDSSSETYLLPENSYTRGYNPTERKYLVVINNDEVRYIHSVKLTYGVGKK